MFIGSVFLCCFCLQPHGTLTLPLWGSHTLLDCVKKSPHDAWLFPKGGKMPLVWDPTDSLCFVISLQVQASITNGFKALLKVLGAVSSPSGVDFLV